MLDETICHQVFDFTTPKTILKSKLFAFEYQIDVISSWILPSTYQIVWTTSHYPCLHGSRSTVDNSRYFNGSCFFKDSGY